MKQFIIILLMLISGLTHGQVDTESIWSTLSEDDVYEFSMSHSGCFSSEYQTITIKKDGEQFIANLNGNSNSELIKSIDTKEMTLEIADLDLLSLYYAELSSKPFKAGFCTSSYTYTVKLNGKVQTTYTDMSCSEADPFSKIVKELYLKS